MTKGSQFISHSSAENQLVHHNKQAGSREETAWKHFLLPESAVDLCCVSIVVQHAISNLFAQRSVFVL